MRLVVVASRASRVSTRTRHVPSTAMEIRPVYAELKNDTFGLMFIFGIRPGRVAYLRGESRLLSSPALYAAPLCRLAFRYRLPDDFSGALRASMGNESVLRIDRKWNGMSSNDTCAPTWSWRPVAIRSIERFVVFVWARRIGRRRID